MDYRKHTWAAISLGGGSFHSIWGSIFRTFLVSIFRGFPVFKFSFGGFFTPFAGNYLYPFFVLFCGDLFHIIFSIFPSIFWMHFAIFLGGCVWCPFRPAGCPFGVRRPKFYGQFFGNFSCEWLFHVL